MELKEFQFFPKDGGFVIYNPVTQNFVQGDSNGGVFCSNVEFS